jgi:ectoine hydroxylase
MTHRATPAEREQFENDGFFVREAAFRSHEIEELREAVERVNQLIQDAADPSESRVTRIDGKRYEEVLGATVKWDWAEGSRGIRSMEPFHHLDPRLDELVDDPRLWEPTLDLIDCEGVSLFTDKLNFKRPDGAPFPWHQDSPYWAFECDHVDRLVSVGLYLDDATQKNGCLWMMAGSHRHGFLPGQKSGETMASLYTDVDALEDRRPVAAEGPAGTVLVFHADIVHGSEPNRTNESRRAVLFTYQPPGLPRWHFEDVRIPFAERGGRPSA